MRALLLSCLLVGCGNQPPTIRMLSYSPNAGFVGIETMISGTFLFSDADSDTSQSVAEVSNPNGNLVFRTRPEPIQNAGQGIMGTANFTLTFTPMLKGIYHFTVWEVDLTALESNHLEGTIRAANNAPYGPDNP